MGTITMATCTVAGCADPGCSGAPEREHTGCGTCGRKFSTPAPSAMCLFCNGGVTPLPEVCNCGHRATPNGICAGYARTSDGRTVCYPCADREQAEQVAAAQPGDRFFAYLSGDGATVTTWTGGTLMRGVRFGAVHPWTRGSWSGERNYMTAVDPAGRVWSGTGAPGMYATLRLTKRTR